MESPPVCVLTLECEEARKQKRFQNGFSLLLCRGICSRLLKGSSFIEQIFIE